MFSFYIILIAALCILNIQAFMSPLSSMRTSSNLLLNMGQDFAIKYDWIDAIRKTDIEKGDMIGIVLAGQSILCVRTANDKYFALSNRSAYLGIPLEYGQIDGEDIICPQSKTRFDLNTGNIVGEWVPFPPILNNVLRLVIGDPEPISTYPVRVKGNSVQIQVDMNYVISYEKNYWKGLLDARGKEDGSYY